MRRLSGFLLACCAFATHAQTQAQTVATPLHARIEGAALHPGEYALSANARLSDAVLAALPDRTAYPLGASLLREDAKTAQVRQKAGLLFDLQALSEAPGTPDALRALATSLHGWLDALPVTGRVRTQLEPRALELDVDANLPLHDGDIFVYPTRPDSVRVVGAVDAACEQKHAGLRDARDYLRACAIDAFADKDWLYAIQPDGHVEKLGIALWNRSAPYALAPGAVLYVPIAGKHLAAIDPDFNAQMTQFLATQHLPAAGETR